MFSTHADPPTAGVGCPWLVAIAYTDLASDNRVIRAARAAADAGWRVTILAPRGRHRDFRMKNVDIVWLEADQQRGRTTVGGQLRFMRTVARWVRTQRQVPDVVHVHNMPDYLYWAVRGWHRQGSRVVVDVHDIMSELALHRFGAVKRRPASWLLGVLERAVWRRADHVITVHVDYHDTIVAAKINPAKVTVVLNVPDSSVCSPRMRRTPPQDQFKIVFHGTISSRTGVAHAVRAMPLLLEQVPQARLLIIGDGDGAEEVRRLIATLKLEAQVEFIDQFLPMQEVLDRICDAHAAVVPNEPSVYTKGILPVKLLEYSALQIPVVATRLPLIDTYFGEDCLHLIPEPAPNLIAEGLARLARDPGYGAHIVNGTRNFLAVHGWERYRSDLLEALMPERNTSLDRPRSA